MTLWNKKGGGIKRKPLKHALRGPKRHQGRTKHKKTGKTTDEKIWSLKRADKEFRLILLANRMNADYPICVFPGCQIKDPKKLTVSHYFGRVNKATRFDMRNCDLLCRNHHYWDKQLGWEFQKQTKEKHGWNGRYTIYMKQKLGTTILKELQSLAESSMKQKIAIQQFQAELSATQ